MSGRYDLVAVARVRDNDELAELVRGREDIVLIDGFLNEAQRNRLTASCDCYVSLHRSEGFGLTIAEAMANCAKRSIRRISLAFEMFSCSGSQCT